MALLPLRYKQTGKGLHTLPKFIFIGHQHTMTTQQHLSCMNNVPLVSRMDVVAEYVHEPKYPDTTPWHAALPSPPCNFCHPMGGRNCKVEKVGAHFYQCPPRTSHSTHDSPHDSLHHHPSRSQPVPVPARPRPAGSSFLRRPRRTVAGWDGNGLAHGGNGDRLFWAVGFKYVRPVCQTSAVKYRVSGAVVSMSHSMNRPREKPCHHVACRIYCGSVSCRSVCWCLMHARPLALVVL